MKIAFCDDNRKQIQAYIPILQTLGEKYSTELTISYYENANQMLFDLEERQREVNLIFLDVHMPGQNGIDVARKLLDYSNVDSFVLLTVSKNHVFDAFDLGAMNYIVKGYNDTVERIESVFLQALHRSQERKNEYLLCAAGGEQRQIPVRSIYYFTVSQKLITVYYNKDDSFTFYSTIGKLEACLFGKGFVKANRSCLVACEYIARLEYERITLTNGSVLPVGRKYYQALKDELHNSGFTTAV